MPKEIFRKVALERMSSPEQLDQLITVTSPTGWISLLVLGGLLVTAVLWGIYGSIPTQVQGQGIILGKEGILGIQAQNTGEVIRMNVSVGDIVEEGQIIARIAQDDILERIREAQLRLKNLAASFEERKKLDQDTKRIQLQELELREVNQQQQIKNFEIQLDAQMALYRQQQEYKTGLEELKKDGIVSKNQVIEVENALVEIQQNINTLRLEVEKARNQLNTISLEITRIQGQETVDDLSYAQETETIQLEIRTLQNLFAKNSQIVSDYRGRVLEVLTQQGELAHAGSSVLLIEPVAAHSNLEVIVYFSPLVGKQIQKGMPAQIAPSIVKREEYGFLEGVVSEVDKYPSTLTTVMKTLQNDALAQMLTANAAPIRVIVTLIPDSNTPSGYKWSSRSGPPIDIQSGTICSAEIIVKEQAPITLVIPILRKFLLGIEDSGA